MKIKIACLAIGLLLLCQFIVIVNAETETTPYTDKYDLFGWLQHTFNQQQFSIVGTSRSCSIGYDKEFSISPGTSFVHSASEYCNSGYGLFDVFTNGWNKFREYKNSVAITCNPNNANNCNVQVYCCSHDECSSDSDCSWAGPNQQCKSATCSQVTSGIMSGGYLCTTDSGTELMSGIAFSSSSFKYCTQAASSTITVVLILILPQHVLAPQQVKLYILLSQHANQTFLNKLVFLVVQENLVGIMVVVEVVEHVELMLIAQVTNV
jgi:hypothetical protein